MSGGITLDPSQLRAVQAALSNPLTVITGGPGTGKTTICRAVLEELRGRIACCSPTGKAAKRLSEQTGFEASTIHRLLAYHPEAGFRYNALNPLPVDALIVDESSMIDVELAGALLAAVPSGARVIFVGDVDQLPPVGPGAFFHDLIASETVPVMRLEVVHRQRETSWITRNAALINAGKRPCIDGADDFFFTPAVDAHGVNVAVISLVDELIAGGLRKSDIQVLSPQRTGECGVSALNELLQAKLNPPLADARAWQVGYGQSVHENDRVLHSRNNYELGVMNGESGHVLAITKASLTVDFEDRTVVYDHESSRDLQLCYATTVHKSQGSEYPCVICVVSSSHTFMLSRRLLYTAVTRGKHRVHLVGDDRALGYAIRNTRSSRRYTRLSDRIREALVA